MSPETTSSRPYRKRRRAELEAGTRLRITEAAVKLHGSVGPARTSVSAVAKEAGVQRATVYRHFPTEEHLFQACSAHWLAANPPPDPAGWEELEDPAERLRRGLLQLYGWYRSSADMLERTTRDASLVPAMAPAMEGFQAYVGAATDALLAGRRERGAARRRTAAAIGHALSFGAWRSLAQEQGLADREAVALMAAMVEAASAGTGR